MRAAAISPAVDGSSPRARGTRPARIPHGRHRRFIPASAGNTACAASRASTTPVHPRERGEHRMACSAPKASYGSSPRARGTPAEHPAVKALVRFIPASAGNTYADRAGKRAGAVHPRERGEHAPGPTAGKSESGSSPRARGTRSRAGAQRSRRRFIPASAGNTADVLHAGAFPPVHPRERGEHVCGRSAGRRSTIRGGRCRQRVWGPGPSCGTPPAPPARRPWASAGLTGRWPRRGRRHR